MRRDILREIKDIHKFFDYMERNVKTRNPDAVQKAHMFLTHLVYHMEKGVLSPGSIAVDIALFDALEEIDG